MNNKYIKSPFNFVPLDGKPYYPEWADQVSHDIPFEDGVSGEIELKIEAKSPIFIRNGHTKDDAEKTNERYQSFSNVNGRYFIPATSIKGEIRSVLRALTNGKMTQVEDDTFGVRDLSQKSYREAVSNPYCGWLELHGDEYTLTDCGEPGRISISEIDKEYGSKLNDFVRNSSNFKNDSNRMAKAKYDMLYKLGVSNFESEFMQDYELEDKMKEKNPVDPRSFYKFGKGEKGTLVFTGQSGERKKGVKGKMQGKYYEFVIFNNSYNTLTFTPDSREIKSFLSVHKDSPDYQKMWMKKLEKGERIPVFFNYTDSEEDTIHSMGLAYMYKYPYAHSVLDSVPQVYKKKEYDLLELIFGVDGDDALKGRVQIGHAFAEKAEELPSVSLILGSPKASYFPMYIHQDGKSANLYTYNNGIIAGQKRYPTRSDVWGSLNDAQKDEFKKLLTTIKPLSTGTIFNGKIRFHNLKQIELGALLSALTFHNTPHCLHHLGQAKPYGYGNVSYSINLSKLKFNNDDYKVDDSSVLMGLFEGEMLKNNPNWLLSKSIKELFSMSSSLISSNDDRFSYMKLSNSNRKNEFVEAKNIKEYLQPFSKIVNSSVSAPKSLYSDIKAEIEAEEAEEAEKEHKLIEEFKAKLDDILHDVQIEKFESINDITMCEELINKCKEAISKLEDLKNSYSQYDKYTLLAKEIENIEAEKAKLESEIVILESKRNTLKLASTRKGKTLEDLISGKSSIGALLGNTKSYCKDNSLEVLSGDDLLVFKNELVSLFSNMKPRDKKQYANISKWKAISELVGEEVTSDLYKEIMVN